MKTKTTEELKEQLNVLSEKSNKILSELRKRDGNTLIQCIATTPYGKGCGSAFKVKDIVLIQTHWYEPPYSCSGGDAWYRGERQFECPSCGLRNRLYNRPDVDKLKGLFKETIDEYKD